MIEPTFEKFIYCLEAIPDAENAIETKTLEGLEQLAMQGIPSIYNYCDSIEGLEMQVGTLVYDDEHFSDYEIIYLVMKGNKNSIQLNDYLYSLEEIAELFEGKLKGKIIYFANSKRLDLTVVEARYFLDITGARAVIGYGAPSTTLSSWLIDRLFFTFYFDNNDMVEVFELVHKKHKEVCKALDFKMYC